MRSFNGFWKGFAVIMGRNGFVDLLLGRPGKIIFKFGPLDFGSSLQVNLSPKPSQIKKEKNIYTHTPTFGKLIFHEKLFEFSSLSEKQIQITSHHGKFFLYSFFFFTFFLLHYKHMHPTFSGVNEYLLYIKYVE